MVGGGILGVVAALTERDFSRLLTDDSGGPASFATEKEARIAALDWLQDMRRYAMDNPPPGFSGFSEGRIEET